MPVIYAGEAFKPHVHWPVVLKDGVTCATCGRVLSTERVVIEFVRKEA